MEKVDLLIEEGKIKAFLSIEDAGSLKDSGSAEIVDAGGLWVAPGLIDMHVHLREPGEEYKETIRTGTMAAAAGGFVAVACMPNTHPVNDSRSVTEYILQRAAEGGFARVYPVAAVSVGSRGEQLSEFGDLSRAGAVAFSDDGRPVSSSRLMRSALEYARAYDKPIISHAEDLGLSEGGCIHEGEVSAMTGLKGIPSEAEEIMVYRDIELTRFTGGKLHVAHVSTAGSVQLIRQAKARGIRVTAETAPHYFTLTHEAVAEFDTNAKMNPPLRTAEDVEAIRFGLKDGTIDAIATDHAPHSVIEKDIEFELAANGIVGLETCVGLALQLVREGVLNLFQALRALSSNPARILGVAGGAIELGGVANLTLLDSNARYTVDPETFFSLSRNTPFGGRDLQGRAVMTILEGKPVRIKGVAR
ncbi:MAG: dihydroorotase [Deltaproteobacteria bacterium]|nr:dihydroorotase [Deltaproteobacteria bacterium]